MMKLFSQLSTDISIHALLAESDRCCPCAIIAPAISIHALLAESDAAIFFLYCAFPYFYPRSPCGERRFHFNAGQHICVISIHALLAESDAAAGEHRGRTQISIHALLAESDVRCRVGSVRPSNFYPRSPCGERQFCLAKPLYASWIISIHALLAESDHHKSRKSSACCQFLSTLSLRRATAGSYKILPRPVFLSTLSLRRATFITICIISSFMHFYPRSPCGERLTFHKTRCII